MLWPGRGGCRGFAFSNWFTAAITFAFAYEMGFVLTIEPLMQSGVNFNRALQDTFYTETPSITVMEIVAISIDRWLAGEAHFGEALFWVR